MAAPAQVTRAALPRVTVVVPTYRRSAFLERAIASVEAQTWTDWELILVDDNGRGTDDQRATEAEVDRFGSDRVRYLAHPTNLGGGAARNTGIREARGSLVAFLDDDDEWAPEKLAMQVRALDDSPPSVAIVYCRATIVDTATGSRRPWPTSGSRHALPDLLMRNTIGSTSTVLVRRDALLGVGGFDEDLPSKQDIDLYVRLAVRHAFAFVDADLVTLHHHGAHRIGKDLEGTIRAHRIFHEKHWGAISAHPSVIHHRLFSVGQLELAAGHLASARASLFAALRRRPLHLRTAMFAIAACMPRCVVRRLVARRAATGSRTGQRSPRRAGTESNA